MSAANDLYYQIALTQIPNVGPVIGRNLVSYCGGVEAIFKEKISNLAKIPGVGMERAKAIKSAEFFNKAERELEFIKKYQINSFFYLDPQYPQRLKAFENAPLLLYFKGNCDINKARIVAIVGTRKPTDCGRQNVEKLVEALKPYDVCIVSGLAFGVDGLAHKKCVEHDISTVGVVGHGLDRIYPGEHRELSIKMCLNGGLITEFPSGTNPDKENFPMRNRIIAGMCDVLVVVESKVKGGSMITAEMANEYNRDVMAFPGKAQDEYSRGCNALIKKNKAHLMESVEDLIYLMGWEDLKKTRSKQLEIFVELDAQEEKIAAIIRETREISIDDLCYRTQMPSSQMSAYLLGLEFKGLIRSLPGKRYVMVG